MTALRAIVEELGNHGACESCKSQGKGLQFPRTLRQLETYLGMTGALRQYVSNYAKRVEPLQRRKTDLLKGSPLAGRPRKEWSRRAWLDPTPPER